MSLDINFHFLLSRGLLLLRLPLLSLQLLLSLLLSFLSLLLRRPLGYLL